MWSIESKPYSEHLDLSLPQDNRLPWNPWSSTVNFLVNGSEKIRQLWDPWTPVYFQNSGSDENRQHWNPWSKIAPQEARNNGNQQKLQLFSSSKDFSAVDENNSNRKQQTPESFLTDKSMISQNIANENLMKRYQNSNTSKNYFQKSKSLKNRKGKRTSRRKENNVNSSPDLQQLEHRKWNNQPDINWSKTNVFSRPSDPYLHITFRSSFLNKCGEKPRRTFRNSSRGKFANASTNVCDPKVMTKMTVPRDNFESSNFSNHSRNNMGNAVSLNSRNFKNSNKSTIMEGKKNPIASSANSKNTAIGSQSSNEDITYLFTVDSSSEAKMVLEVDLRSNEINLVPNKNSKKADNLNQKGNAKNDESIIILEDHELTGSQPSRKRKLSNTNKKNKKRPSYQPECMACSMRYDDVISKSETMYISSNCGHIFCRPCICKNDNAKVCFTCGVKFILLRKLYM